jgi:hypothetical protein
MQKIPAAKKNLVNRRFYRVGVLAKTEEATV